MAPEGRPTKKNFFCHFLDIIGYLKSWYSSQSNLLLSDPINDGPLTFRRFSPISIGGGSLMLLLGSRWSLSFLGCCSRCLLTSWSLANFLNLIEMGMVLPLADLSAEAFSGALWLVVVNLEFDSTILKQSDEVTRPVLPSGWNFLRRLNPCVASI